MSGVGGWLTALEVDGTQQWVLACDQRAPSFRNTQQLVSQGPQVGSTKWRLLAGHWLWRSAVVSNGWSAGSCDKQGATFKKQIYNINILYIQCIYIFWFLNEVGFTDSVCTCAVDRKFEFRFEWVKNLAFGWSAIWAKFGTKTKKVWSQMSIPSGGILL